ncbi:hypothetical protein Goarm_014816, partial [Gossypium armourianum]|nr:hypothetical protein [Gossypium armourianum]
MLIIYISHGDWLFGFCRNIGSCSAYEAELRGIVDGLTLVSQRGCRRVLVDSDNLSAINDTNRYNAVVRNCSIIRSITDICRRAWEIHFCHVPREANKATDFMFRQFQ